MKIEYIKFKRKNFISRFIDTYKKVRDFDKIQEYINGMVLKSKKDK